MTDNDNSMDDDNEWLVDSIYQRLWHRVCSDVALGMQKLIRSGKIPPSALALPETRYEIYGGDAHGSVEDVGKNLERTATEQPLAKRFKTISGSSSSGAVSPSTRANTPHADETKSSGGVSTGRGIHSSNTSSTPSSPKIGGEEKKTTEGDDSSNNNNNVSTLTMTTRHQQNHTDIWGRIPPKEPKDQAFCSICGRSVSALRFAQHLEKCLGIGTSSRAVAAAVANNG